MHRLPAGLVCHRRDSGNPPKAPPRGHQGRDRGRGRPDLRTRLLCASGGAQAPKRCSGSVRHAGGERVQLHPGAVGRSFPRRSTPHHPAAGGTSPSPVPGLESLKRMASEARQARRAASCGQPCAVAWSCGQAEGLSTCPRGGLGCPSGSTSMRVVLALGRGFGGGPGVPAFKIRFCGLP